MQQPQQPMYQQPPMYQTAEPEYAGYGTRFAALFIDGIIINIPIFILTLILGDVGNLLGIVVAAAYYTYFWSQNNGQSPGKSIMKIRIVRLDGQPISPVTAFLRWIGYSVNTLALFIGWLLPLFDERKQGLHDKIAQTIVIKAA